MNAQDASTLVSASDLVTVSDYFSFVGAGLQWLAELLRCKCVEECNRRTYFSLKPQVRFIFSGS
jgi:hypothetical protein